jgi:hypothetical protein
VRGASQLVCGDKGEGAPRQKGRHHEHRKQPTTAAATVPRGLEHTRQCARIFLGFVALNPAPPMLDVFSKHQQPPCQHWDQTS